MIRLTKLNYLAFGFCSFLRRWHSVHVIFLAWDLIRLGTSELVSLLLVGGGDVSILSGVVTLSQPVLDVVCLVPIEVQVLL